MSQWALARDVGDAHFWASRVQGYGEVVLVFRGLGVVGRLRRYTAGEGVVVSRPHLGSNDS